MKAPPNRDLWPAGSRPRCASGYTLSELLVATALLAVLTVLGISTVGSIRENAGLAGCLGNLRQFGVAFQAYANDHNGYLVRTTANSEPWEGYLDGYLSVTFKEIQSWKAPQVRKTVFNCPSEREPIKPWRCYALNKDFRGDLELGRNPHPSIIRQSDLKFPANYCILADSYVSGYISSDARSKMVGKLTRRHRGRPNFLYADWHAAPFTAELKGKGDSKGDPFYKKLWNPRYTGE